MKRFGRPEEVAEAIVWLLSEKASFVTGSHVNVGGGGAFQQFHGSRVKIRLRLNVGAGQSLSLSVLLAAISCSTTSMQSSCTNRSELCISSREGAETK
jgi:enoyl-ACP reductase-like protein